MVIPITQTRNRREIVQQPRVQIESYPNVSQTNYLNKITNVPMPTQPVPLQYAEKTIATVLYQDVPSKSPYMHVN
jgi:hypothetical protein